MERNKMEVAKQLILKHFSFLETQGYTSNFEIKKDSIYTENLDVTYINKEKKREVGISYTKGKIYEDINYTFHANIIRNPYSGPEDFFSLSIFLKSIKRDFSISLVNKFNEQEAEEIVKKIAEALQVYASKIIDGTEWYEGYYARWD